MSFTRKLIETKAARLSRVLLAAVVLAVVFIVPAAAAPQMSDEDLLYLYYNRFAPEEIKKDARFSARAAAKAPDGFPGRDATLVQLAVVRAWDSLKPETRRELSRYISVGEPRNGAREVNQSSGSCASYLGAAAQTLSSTHFTAYYTTSTTSQDAVSASGTAGSPSYIENLLKYAEEVWEHHIDTLGFTAPPMPEGKYRVYVCDLMGRSGGALLGRTVTDSIVGNYSAASYLELDNDYPTYSLYSDSLENLIKTTMAHEFFHAIQFGLNYYYPSYWALEATATWAEPEVYPSINDWITLYVKSKRLNNLDLSFDYFSFSDTYGYGNAILFKHISEKTLGSAMMKSFWDLVKNDTQACKTGYSYPCSPEFEIVEIPQLEQVITAGGATFAAVFKNFMIANYTKDYAAGSAFSDVPVEATYSSYPKSVTSQSLDHLAGLFYKFLPVSTAYSQKLTVSFNGATNATWGAILLKYAGNGSFTREDISLSSGAGSVSVDGFGTSISSVVLAVVNASTADTGDGAFSFTASADTDCTGSSSTPSSLSAGWNMVTFPMIPLYTAPNQAITVTSTSTGLDTGSIVYYAAATGNSYYGYQNGFQPLGKAGQGYWVYLSSASALSEQGCSPTGTTMTISLDRGWNMFGIPFTTANDVIWGDSRVTVVRNGGDSTHTLSEAVANGWLEPKIYWYNGVSYDETAHNEGVALVPWRAYWLRVNVPMELRFKTNTL